MSHLVKFAQPLRLITFNFGMDTECTPVTILCCRYPTPINFCFCETGNMFSVMQVPIQKFQAYMPNLNLSILVPIKAYNFQVF